MSYSTGILSDRLTILQRQDRGTSAFGHGSKGYNYTPIKTVWADVKFSRGTKALREGALDAYNTVLIRTRYHAELTRDCRVSVAGKIYQIDSLNSDKRENICQLTCTELTGQPCTPSSTSNSSTAESGESSGQNG